MKKVLKVAIIGLGGFAYSHHEAILTLEAEGLVQLVATCDSQLDRFAESDVLSDLERRGVMVYRDYVEMLNAHQEELDFVTVPTPIPLHAPMHRACVERELAVYLEKPPTLNWQELEEMIETDRRGQFPTQVGFNFIVQSARQEIKSRLLDGEFGNILQAGFLGHWPRSTSYFTRANWAGMLRLEGNLILDSCVGNAMAHYIHNLLFWCGKDEVLSWGKVETVEAELYRAHNIQSFDTVFARGKCNDIEIRIGATHASDGPAWQQEWIECERATITPASTGNGFEIKWNDGRRELINEKYESVGDLLVHNLRHFAHTIQGIELRPLTTLSDSRPFVRLNDLLFVAAGHISTVPETRIKRKFSSRSEESVSIEGIEDHLRDFAKSGILPAESNVSWASKGGIAQDVQIEQLEDVVNLIEQTVGNL